MDGWGTDPTLPGEGKCATILIYGESGTGKTLACARMPAPVAWIAIEDNALESVWAAGYKPIYRRVSSYDEAMDAVFDLRRNVERAIKDGRALPVRSVILDSVTSAEDTIIEELVSKRAKGLVQDSRPEVLSQGGYGVLGGRHRALREAILRIPLLHKVYIALPKSRSGDGTTTAVVPSISGQQGGRFPAYCNWVLYQETFKIGGKVRRRFLTKHSGITFAKDRLGMLAEEEPADLAVLMAKGGFIRSDETFMLRDGTLGSRADADTDWDALCAGLPGRKRSAETDTAGASTTG